MQNIEISMKIVESLRSLEHCRLCVHTVKNVTRIMQERVINYCSRTRSSSISILIAALIKLSTALATSLFIRHDVSIQLALT